MDNWPGSTDLCASINGLKSRECKRHGSVSTESLRKLHSDIMRVFAAILIISFSTSSGLQYDFPPYLGAPPVTIPPAHMFCNEKSSRVAVRTCDKSGCRQYVYPDYAPPSVTDSVSSPTGGAELLRWIAGAAANAPSSIYSWWNQK